MSKTPENLTLDQIMAHFGTDDAAREYLEGVRWPDGPVCPHCGNSDRARIYDLEPNPAKKIRPGLRECAECHGQFTVTVGTIFEDSKIPLRKWLVAWYLLCSSKKGIAALQIQRMLCHDDTFKPHTDAKAALLVLERKQGEAHEDNYSVFMAISQGIGHNGLGEPLFKTDAKGDEILVNGQHVLDHDCEEIYEAWKLISEGGKSPSDYCFSIKRRDINKDTLNLNPVRYLPKYSKSRKQVLALGEEDGWTVEHLSQIATVFNGPRFRRPYASKDVTRGPNIVRFFTGNAVTQTRGENIKYLDLAKAKPAQLRMIEKLYLRRGMLLITRSGTIGRVIYATAYHDGAVGTEDVIRVVIEDEALRGYVYQFLLSRLGQHQLRANVYGAIVDHIEAKHVKDVLVPIPTDRSIVEEIGSPIIRAIHLQEHAYAEAENSRLMLAEELGDFSSEDARDAEIARQRLEEIRKNPAMLIEGDDLAAELEELLS